MQDIEQELAELKTQLDALKSERETAQVAESEETMDSVADRGPIDEETLQQESDTQDLADQFRELFENLNEQLKEANPTTLLVVFALGVLLGRTLSK